MAAKSINYESVPKAIKTGIIPGSYSQDRKTFTFNTLRYKNNKDKILEWTIIIELKCGNKILSVIDEMFESGYKFNTGCEVHYKVISGQENGKIRDCESTIVTSGKNIGKINETNMLSQAFRDALGIYNKQTKKILSQFESFNPRPPPMLLSKLNDKQLDKLDFKRCIIQKKFNGVRYIIYIDNNGIVIQYSRSSAEYHPLPKISDDVQILLSSTPKIRIGKYGIETDEQVKVYERANVYLDGELYAEGLPLNVISGQARKVESTIPLSFYVFDIFFPVAIEAGFNMTSINRQEYLKDLFAGCVYLRNIQRVPYERVQNRKELDKLLSKYVKEGYEGLVIRKDDCGYVYSYNNYHTTNVLKYKPVSSDEFTVVDFTQGSKGKDVGKVIWICEVTDPNGDPKRFSVVPNMTQEARARIYKCLSENDKMFEKYVKDQPLTIEYTELSESNIPQQPRGIVFRTYENKKDKIEEFYKKCNIQEF